MNITLQKFFKKNSKSVLSEKLRFPKLSPFYKFHTYFVFTKLKYYEFIMLGELIFKK